MQPLEQILQEITAFENQLSRRSFMKSAAFLVAFPGFELKLDDRKFLDRVAATLLPAEALRSTGISVAENVACLVQQGSAEHRAKVLRFLSWSQRAAIFYGGDKVALNARGSRSMLVRKMGRTLSDYASCLSIRRTDITGFPTDKKVGPTFIRPAVNHCRFW